MIDNNTNIFMNIIYKKVNKSFKNFFKYKKHAKSVKKFRKRILEGSPSFGLLWKMADFIKLAEIVFFYNNSIKNEEFGLFSSKKYSYGENGFRISTKECIIVLKLFSDSQKVMLEIERKGGDGNKTSLSFIENEWITEPSIYDEMLLEQIIKIINEKIIKLFDYCYDIR